MAPTPENDKTQKAPPDKTADKTKSEKGTLRLGDENVLCLNDGQLKELLDEAITYRNPKDREGKSQIFNDLLTIAEESERNARAARAGGSELVRHCNPSAKRSGTARYRTHHRKPTTSTSSASSSVGGSMQSVAENRMHGGSLDNLAQEELFEAANLCPRKSVSASQWEGGSLPCNVNSSSLSRNRAARCEFLEEARRKREHRCDSDSAKLLSNTNSTITSTDNNTTTSITLTPVSIVTSDSDIVSAIDDNHVLMTDQPDGTLLNIGECQQQPPLVTVTAPINALPAVTAVTDTITASTTASDLAKFTTKSVGIPSTQLRNQNSNSTTTIINSSVDDPIDLITSDDRNRSNVNNNAADTAKLLRTKYNLYIPSYLANGGANNLLTTNRIMLEEGKRMADDNGNTASHTTSGVKSKKKKNSSIRNETICTSENMKGHRSDIINDVSKLMEFIGCSKGRNGKSGGGGGGKPSGRHAQQQHHNGIRNSSNSMANDDGATIANKSGGSKKNANKINQTNNNTVTVKSSSKERSPQNNTLKKSNSMEEISSKSLNDILHNATNQRSGNGSAGTAIASDTTGGVPHAKESTDYFESLPLQQNHTTNIGTKTVKNSGQSGNKKKVFSATLTITDDTGKQLVRKLPRAIKNGAGIAEVNNKSYLGVDNQVSNTINYDLIADSVSEASDFRVVTKKRKSKKRQESELRAAQHSNTKNNHSAGTTLSNSSDTINGYHKNNSNNINGHSRSRLSSSFEEDESASGSTLVANHQRKATLTRSVPHSEKSNDSSDTDSVHSLPADAGQSTATINDSYSVSYADIARNQDKLYKNANASVKHAENISDTDTVSMTSVITTSKENVDQNANCIPAADVQKVVMVKCSPTIHPVNSVSNNDENGKGNCDNVETSQHHNKTFNSNEPENAHEFGFNALPVHDMSLPPPPPPNRAPNVYAYNYFHARPQDQRVYHAAKAATERLPNVVTTTVPCSPHPVMRLSNYSNAAVPPRVITNTPTNNVNITKHKRGGAANKDEVFFEQNPTMPVVPLPFNEAEHARTVNYQQQVAPGDNHLTHPSMPMNIPDVQTIEKMHFMAHNLYMNQHHQHPPPPPPQHPNQMYHLPPKNSNSSIPPPASNNIYYYYAHHHNQPYHQNQPLVQLHSGGVANSGVANTVITTTPHSNNIYYYPINQHQHPSSSHAKVCDNMKTFSASKTKVDSNVNVNKTNGKCANERNANGNSQNINAERKRMSKIKSEKTTRCEEATASSSVSKSPSSAQSSADKPSNKSPDKQQTESTEDVGALATKKPLRAQTPAVPLAASTTTNTKDDPPVVILSGLDNQREVPGLVFGFEVNERLLSEDLCDNFASRYRPPSEFTFTSHNHDRIVHFISSSWQDIMHDRASGKASYYTE